MGGMKGEIREGWRERIEQMTQAVADFVGGTEQSDDLTMLALHSN